MNSFRNKSVLLPIKMKQFHKIPSLKLFILLQVRNADILYEDSRHTIKFCIHFVFILILSMICGLQAALHTP